jgi:hypothetical protein
VKKITKMCWCVIRAHIRWLTGGRQEVRSESSAVTALMCSSTSSFICCCCCNCYKVRRSKDANVAAVTCCRSSPRTRISALRRSRLQLRQTKNKAQSVFRRRQFTCPVRMAAALLPAFPPQSLARALQPSLNISLRLSKFSASNTSHVKHNTNHTTNSSITITCARSK